MPARRNEHGVWEVRQSIPVSIDMMTGDLLSIIEYLKDLEKTATGMGMIDTGYLDMTVEEGYYNSHHITASYDFSRVEYDSERVDREAQEAKIKERDAAIRKAKREQTKDPEYLEFQRLKKKFKD